MEDFSPDYTNVVQAARNIEAKRMPLYEHFIADSFIEKVIQRPFAGLALGDEKDKRQYFRELLDFHIQMGYDTISFEINGVHFEFDSSSTLRQIMSRINSSDAGVKMSYSSLTDSFVLTASTTGSGQTIRITNLEGNLFPDQEGQEGSIGISTLQAEGRDAVLSINGVRITRSTNSFTIDGLSYTLKETYSAAQAEESPIKITA
mgnify:CR=1 FL=1